MEKNEYQIRQYISQQKGNDGYLEGEYFLIPYIVDKPDKNVYGLTDISQERADFLNEQDQRYKKLKHVFISVDTIIIGAGLLISSYFFGVDGFNESGVEKFINSILGWSVITCFIDIFLAITFSLSISKKLKDLRKKFQYDSIDERKQLIEYKRNMSFFDYWNKRKELSYWAILNEAELNRTLVQIYRRLGYNASVEHLLYGQHREVVIYKNGVKEVISVQKIGKSIDKPILDELASLTSKNYDKVNILTLSSTPLEINKYSKTKKVALINWSSISKLI